MSLLLAQSGHGDCADECSLSGVKRTLASPTSRNGALWNVGPDHSGLMFANLITLAHFSVSSTMSLPNSTGVIDTGVQASSAKRAFNDASARAALISLSSFSMMSVGMFFGAPTPYQTLPS